MNVCASLLMAPTQACWNTITEPPNQSLLGRIKQAVVWPLAAIAIFFTLPMFFLGAYVQLIVWPINFCMSFIPTIHPRFLQIEIYPQHPEVREDFRNLQQLKQLFENPTRRNYENLPELQRYLIAARHTYHTLNGWYFTSKEGIQQIFLGTLREDLSYASRGIREAITSQEGIIFAKTLKREFQRGNILAGLIADGSYHYRNLLSRLSYSLGDENDIESARVFIETHPTDLRIQRALDDMISFLSDGY